MPIVLFCDQVLDAVVRDAALSVFLGHSEVGQAALAAGLLGLGGNKIAQRIKDQSPVAILSGHPFTGLQHMGMGANHHIRAAV